MPHPGGAAACEAPGAANPAKGGALAEKLTGAGFWSPDKTINPLGPEDTFIQTHIGHDNLYAEVRKRAK